MFEYFQLQRLAQAGGQTVFYIFMSLIAVIVVFSGCLCLFVAQVKQRLPVWWPLLSHKVFCLDIPFSPAAELQGQQLPLCMAHQAAALFSVHLFRHVL